MNDVQTIILAVQKWSFDDEKTGQNKQGVSVHIVPLGQPSTNDDILGTKPMKYTLTLSEYNQFLGFKYPALANVDFVMNFTNGKISPVEFKNIQSLNFKEIAELI